MASTFIENQRKDQEWQQNSEIFENLLVTKQHLQNAGIVEQLTQNPWDMRRYTIKIVSKRVNEWMCIDRYAESELWI